MHDRILRTALACAVHGAAALYLPLAVARTRTRPGYLRLALARAGWGASPTATPEGAPERPGDGPRVVVHACSVGESLAVLPLLERLREAVPGVRLLHTVTTMSGFDLAVKRSTADRVAYLPLDVRPGVARFLAAERPDLFVAVETELWPTLFFALSDRGIPIALVNGRISDRSLPRYRRFAPFTRATLDRVSLFLMQSAEDARRAMLLGAPPHRVVVPGNLKFDALEPIVRDPAPRHRFGFPPSTPLFAFGSIHPGEEDACLGIMRAARAADPRIAFLLAPRKFDRLEETVARLAAAEFRVARWSERKGTGGRTGTTETADLLVIDTFGELVDAYRASFAAFVGGSFVATGGHNILEVAACGKPVFHGPRMENFRDIAALAAAEGFGFELADPASGAEKIAAFVADPALTAAAGAKARAALARRVGASRRSARLLAGLLGGSIARPA